MAGWFLKNAHELGGGFGMEGSHMYRINGKNIILLVLPGEREDGKSACVRIISMVPMNTNS